MNNQLIAKVIKYNNKNCPNFVYDNPLLDKNLAGLLAKSFVKILAISKDNTGTNNNLRHCILENIRKLCQTNSDGHIPIDENFHETLVQLYKEHIENKQESSLNTLERKLDMFLLRKLSEDEFNIALEPSVNPELVQALINLGSEKITDSVLTDLIYWDPRNLKCKNILKEIWSNECETSKSSLNIINDISIKMRTGIEETILNLVLNVLQSDNKVIELKKEHEHLCRICSKSPKCFQITCKVLNHLLVNSNFHTNIAGTIVLLINKIKGYCIEDEFCLLYKVNQQSIVLLMDIDISLMTIHKEFYIKNVLSKLDIVKTDSEHNLVMLLSHFPVWFDIYYENNMLNK